MYFTQEDYRKIEGWLLQNTMKDTQFSGASLPLKGTETIAFVQDGKNVKATVKSIVDQLFLLGVSDFQNLTDKYGELNITLAQAIQLIPFRSRKIGQVITFINQEGKWVIWQFLGTRINQWNNLSLWVDILGSLVVTDVVPDNEDLTGVRENQKLVLKFADKAYNSSLYSGLGRVYLRKNIVIVQDVSGLSREANVLLQSMIAKENTIYHILYDYDLNGATIIIPKNSTLHFEGGSLSNGTLQGNKTKLSGDINILCSGSGTFDVREVNVRHFGAKGDSVTDDSAAFRRALTFLTNRVIATSFDIGCNTLYIPSGSYYVTEVTCENVNIIGESELNTSIRGSSQTNAFIITLNNEYGPKSNIKGLYFRAGKLLVKKTSTEISNCMFGGNTNYIDVHQTSDVLIHDCVFDMSPQGIIVTQCAHIIISNNIFFANAVLAVDIVAGTGIQIVNNRFSSVRGLPIAVKSGSNVLITNNTFEASTETLYALIPIFIGLYNPVIDYAFEDIVISGNILKDTMNRYTGISCTTVGKEVSRLVIKDNLIDGGNYGIRISDGAKYAVISNNTISGCKLTSIVCFPEGAQVDNNIMTDGAAQAAVDTVLSSSILTGTLANITNNKLYFTATNNLSYFIYVNGSGQGSTVLGNYIQTVVGPNFKEYYKVGSRYSLVHRVFSAPSEGSSLDLPNENMIGEGFEYYQTDTGKTIRYTKDFGWVNSDGTLLSKVIII